MQKRNSLVTIAAAAVIILLLVILAQIGWLRPITGMLERAFSPLSRVFYRAGSIFQKNPSGTLSINDLQKRLESIEADNRRLTTENVRLSDLEHENDVLRKQLGFYGAHNFSYVVAGVTARGRIGDSWRQFATLTLNRGSQDGLKAGQPVVDADGALLGKLTRVEDHFSQACLLFDNSCRIAVSLQGVPGTAGVIQSDLNLTVKIDYIPQNISVTPGQVVITSGLEEAMPSGLLVGKVNQVVSEGNELWQHAVVDPVADFNDLKIVSIIK